MPDSHPKPDQCGRYEGDVLILPPGGVTTVVQEAHRLRAEVEALRELYTEENNERAKAQAENGQLRGLLTLWLNCAPGDTREIVPGPNGLTLEQLTRRSFDETSLPNEGTV